MLYKKDVSKASAFVIKEPEGSRYIAFGLPPRVSAYSVQLPRRYEKMATALISQNKQEAFDMLFTWAASTARAIQRK